MKDILRRLLEAEEAGRQQAAELEAAGEELLRQAAAERDAAVTQIQLETARQVDELTREMTPSSGSKPRRPSADRRR